MDPVVNPQSKENTKENITINLNGEITPLAEAKVSVLDRGFLYGDSIFETLLSYEGKIPLLDHHLDRFFNSAKALFIQPPFDREELALKVKQTLKASDLKSAYIRFILTRGTAPIGLSMESCKNPQFVIIVKPFHGHPEENYQKGVHIIKAETRRLLPESLPTWAKTGNYLNNMLAFREAEARGAYEALMLNQKDEVAECTVSNVWMVNKEGVILTPPASVGILEGITRKIILKILKDKKIPHQVQAFGFEELLQAKECFLTSTTRIVLPVTRIEEQKIGAGVPGPVALELRDLYYREIVN